MGMVWFWQRKDHQMYQKSARREGAAVISEISCIIFWFSKGANKVIQNTVGIVVDLPR